MTIKEQVKEYIKEELKKLKYTGDKVKLINVYPEIIEEVIGYFNEPYDLNGYDCDYWAKTYKYEIYGSMRFGTAEVELIKGLTAPKITENADNDNVDSEIMKEIDYTIPPVPEAESWETFYFTFGYGHKQEGYYQPIKVPNRGLANKRMFLVYGTKWSFDYTENEWLGMEDRYKGKPLELIYGDESL